MLVPSPEMPVSRSRFVSGLRRFLQDGQICRPQFRTPGDVRPPSSSARGQVKPNQSDCRSVVWTPIKVSALPPPRSKFTLPPETRSSPSPPECRTFVQHCQGKVARGEARRSGGVGPRVGGIHENDPDRGCGGRVLHRVLQQIIDRDLDQARIRRNDGRRVGRVEFDPMVGSGGGDHLDCLAHQPTQIDAVALQVDRPAIDPVGRSGCVRDKSEIPGDGDHDRQDQGDPCQHQEAGHGRAPIERDARDDDEHPRAGHHDVTDQRIVPIVAGIPQHEPRTVRESPTRLSNCKERPTNRGVRSLKRKCQANSAVPKIVKANRKW